MTDEDKTKNPARSLRQRATDFIEQAPGYCPATPPEAVQEIIHELQVHQVELTMQNEELRDTQLTLQRARDRYANLFDSAPIGYVSFDETGTIRQANLTIAHMLGVDRGSLVGAPLVDAVALEDRDRLYLHRRHLFESGEPQMGELRLLRNNNAPFWARIESTLTRDPDGQTLGRVAISDITEHHRIEAQLREAEKLAALGQLTSGIAKDFSDALSAILLSAQIAQTDVYAAPGTRIAVATIVDATQKTTKLVRQLLDFSRKALMDTAARSLVEVVETTLPRISRRLPSTVTLTTNLTDEPCTVQLDAARMGHVLMNLVDNACDAMPDGGQIHIEVAPYGDVPPPMDAVEATKPCCWARLTITDTGTGMSTTVQDHLFEPFFTTKRTETASGLGLAQVYGIVTQHGGYIDVDTALGTGTAVNIYLPLVETAGLPAPVRSAAGPRRGRGERLLVVDDNAPLRAAIHDLLASLGYEVDTAPDGLAALDAVRAARFDLVITDIAMPGLTGEGLLREIQALHDPPPVIAITGRITDADIADLRTAGFLSVIHKPFAVEEITATVRAVLDRRSDL